MKSKNVRNETVEKIQTNEEDRKKVKEEVREMEKRERTKKEKGNDRRIKGRWIIIDNGR